MKYRLIDLFALIFNLDQLAGGLLFGLVFVFQRLHQAVVPVAEIADARKTDKEQKRQ